MSSIIENDSLSRKKDSLPIIQNQINKNNPTKLDFSSHIKQHRSPRKMNSYGSTPKNYVKFGSTPKNAVKKPIFGHITKISHDRTDSYQSSNFQFENDPYIEAIRRMVIYFYLEINKMIIEGRSSKTQKCTSRKSTRTNIYYSR